MNIIFMQRKLCRVHASLSIHNYSIYTWYCFAWRQPPFMVLHVCPTLSPDCLIYVCGMRAKYSICVIKALSSVFFSPARRFVIWLARKVLIIKRYIPVHKSLNGKCTPIGWLRKSELVHYLSRKVFKSHLPLLLILLIRRLCRENPDINQP